MRVYHLIFTFKTRKRVSRFVRDREIVTVFQGIPLESTDGERLEKCAECMYAGLCVNPYHISIAVRELDLFLANFIHTTDPDSPSGSTPSTGIVLRVISPTVDLEKKCIIPILIGRSSVVKRHARAIELADQETGQLSIGLARFLINFSSSKSHYLEIQSRFSCRRGWHGRAQRPRRNLGYGGLFGFRAEETH